MTTTCAVTTDDAGRVVLRVSRSSVRLDMHGALALAREIEQAARKGRCRWGLCTDRATITEELFGGFTWQYCDRHKSRQTPIEAES